MEQLTTSLLDLGSGIWAIDQVMVRSFLILGQEQALLLDTGAGSCDIMALIRSVTELPVTVVHSHGDGDHTENDSQFQDIYVHPDEVPVILRFRPQLTTNLLPVTEGHRFDLGGRVLEVVEAPGHTPGSICLLDRKNRILFSGDSLGYGPVFLFGDHRDIRRYRASLDKLDALTDYDTIYPCHNSCPVSRVVIQELKVAVDGALDGSIIPTENDMPMPDGLKPKVFSCGSSGILYA